MKEEMIFYPKFSIWPYVILFGIEIFFLVMLIATLYPFFTHHKLESHVGLILIIGALLIVVAMIIFGDLIVIYRTMKYEFREDGLHLMCGGYHDVIKYKDIEKWEKKNLVFNPLASKRLPGFSLGNVYYSDEGLVKMYATSAGRNVLLIRTKVGKYGITPAPEDYDRFIEELKRRVEEKQQY